MVTSDRRLINGAEAMALAFNLAGVRVAYAYPITPQSEVMELLASDPNITCVASDSEYNVLAGAEGVLWAGERCAIATASQGLLYMSEVMWEVAGNRLPLVMGVFSRAVKGPGWCLGAQQNDVLFMRDTGWLHFMCESAQQMMDLMLIAFRVAEKVSLPAIVSGDGYYVSHQKEPVYVPDLASSRQFVGDPPRQGLPTGGTAASYGALVPPASFLRLVRHIYEDMESALGVFVDASAEFADRFGRRYSPVDFLCADDADTILVTAGSIGGTAEHVVRMLRQQGMRVGLARMRCLRPFPAAMLRHGVRSAKRLVVVDRNLLYGIGGAVAAETRLALDVLSGPRPSVYSFVAGLGGIDVTPEMLMAAVEYAETKPPTVGRPLFVTEAGVEG
jgi:pyruvate/2-oxoacid:ferredoxin oxidoreductase alpha subunit